MKRLTFSRYSSNLKFKLILPAVTAFMTMLILLALISLIISSQQIAEVDNEKGITLCSLLSGNLNTSLSFQDNSSAETDLKKLQNDKGFLFAAVFDDQNKPFVSVYKNAVATQEGTGEQNVPQEETLPLTADAISQLTEKDNLVILEDTFHNSPVSLFILKIADDSGKTLGHLLLGLSQESRNKASKKLSFWLILTGSLSLLIVLLFFSFILNRAIKPLVKTTDIMEELSEGSGDLTVRLDVKTKDEIGRLSNSFNNFVDKLRAILLSVRDASSSISGNTDELSDASLNLSKRTNEQAASITETSTTLDGFTNIVNKNSENARTVSQQLSDFNQSVESNRDLMNNVTSTMKEIESSSRKIDNIIAVINDISFQTNLLALNAAVEAARAGDAGRGFAVVAAEVRNLAQKTAESSKTIQEIVTSNVQSTKKGMGLVEETSNFFQSILNTVRELTGRINEINEGSKEQSTGIEQINQAVIQLEDVISQNASLVEQLSSTSKTMNQSAQELNDLVNQFQL